MKRILFVLFASMIARVAIAVPSAGNVASNTNEFLEIIVGIIVVILYVAALAVFVSACMKYRLHRQNPQQVPLSTPLTELVLAIVLGALPTVSQMTNDHLFKSESKLIQSQKTPRGPSGVVPAQRYQQPQQQRQQQPYAPPR